MRQATQLAKYDQTAAAEALKIVDIFPARAAKIAAAGLKRVLGQLNPQPTLGEVLTRLAETGTTRNGDHLSPAVAGRKLEIAPNRWIFCDSAGDWRLFNPGGNSVQVLYWGRDFNTMSSAQAGKWKLADNIKMEIKSNG
jgi:hypothetical protein